MTLVEEILHRCQIEYRPHGSKPQELLANCPFCAQRGHTPDQKMRLGINLRLQKAHCFHCDYACRGLLKFARELLATQSLPFRISLQQQRGILASEPTQEAEEEPDIEPTPLPDEYEVFSPNSRDAIQRAAWKYLRERGVGALQVSQHRIGFAAAGRYGYRLVLPVLGPQGVSYGFATRSFADAKPKYLNSPGHLLLWNGQAGGQTAIETEGVFDALSVERAVSYQSPGTVAVATLGSATTSCRIQQLLKYPQGVIILPDADAAGIKGVLGRAEEYTRAGIKVRVSVPAQLDGRDPNQLLPAEIRAAIASAREWNSNTRARLRALKEEIVLW